MAYYSEQCEGTVVPYEDFSAEADAEELRDAMKGFGTDEDKITPVLGARAAWQRLEIVTQFKTMYGKDLVEELESELGGNFKAICLALCMPPAQFDAHCLHNAISGAGTDDDCLVEILCTRTNEEIKAISEVYQEKYETSLEEDIIGDTSGHFKRLLVSLLTANRDESAEVDEDKVEEDARELFEAGEDKLGTDESTFNMVLATRSFPHLQAVFSKYYELAEKDIEDSLQSELSGNVEEGMLTIVRCVKDRPAAFAKALNASMKGLGTEDDSLIRVVVSRAEIDMVQIKQAFLRDYEKTLAEFISDDCSGDYERILLQLIGEPKED